jgi:hypothetical protein
MLQKWLSVNKPGGRTPAGPLRIASTQKEGTVAEKNRPTIPGHEEIDLQHTDPETAVALLEDALKKQAESLRRIRSDYVHGVISAEDLEKVEARFGQLLVEQRKILQLLRKRRPAV